MGKRRLVEYAPGNRAMWATGTSSQYSDLEMQGDGNLVVYQPGHAAIWSTGTCLDSLWNGENGWRWSATNPPCDAYHSWLSRSPHSY
jgi:hypothetical protein